MTLLRSLLTALSLLGVLWASSQAATMPGSSTAAGLAAPTSDTVKPLGVAGAFINRLNATFGNTRPNATIRDKRDLGHVAYFRYIYGDAATVGDGTDGLYSNYRSRHRDYPEGDPRSLHVFTADTLVLKAHCGLGAGVRMDCSDGHIESGILRFALPIEPGSYIEIRCKMPTGMYAWPAFWLNPGVEHPPTEPGGKPTFSALHWPPEIDIFDQFGFNDTPPGHYLISATPTGGHDADYGHPHDIYRAPNWGDKWYYQTSQDLTAAFHVYALDWRSDHTLRFLLDGKLIRETYYEWNSQGNVPAHLITSLQIGPKFNDLSHITDQGGKPNGWDWPIDYVRVWTRVRLADVQDHMK